MRAREKAGKGLGKVLMVVVVVKKMILVVVNCGTGTDGEHHRDNNIVTLVISTHRVALRTKFFV